MMGIIETAEILKKLEEDRNWNFKMAEAWFEIEDDYKELLFRSTNFFQKMKLKRELKKVRKIINGLTLV